MAKIKKGSKAPNFRLKDKKGEVYSLKNLDGEYKVVYFYPKDDTPGCTIEAKGFNKDLLKYKKRGIAIAGISGGDEKSKAHFCAKYKLKIPLLSDPDFKTSKKYGAYGKKSFMGRTYNGILRKTFLLDSKDRVLKVYEKVTPEGHSKEILEDIKELEAS